MKGKKVFCSFADVDGVLLTPLLSYSQRQALPAFELERLSAHFESEHNGQFHETETPVIRLHATKSDSKTSSRCYCTC
jgi:hypothetical protein